MADRNIRAGGNSGLFYYSILCSYANFRTPYKRVDGISYTILPGEWLCSVRELTEWFRVRFQHQALAVLDDLQQKHIITYTLLGHGSLLNLKSLTGKNITGYLTITLHAKRIQDFSFYRYQSQMNLFHPGKRLKYYAFGHKASAYRRSFRNNYISTRFYGNLLFALLIFAKRAINIYSVMALSANVQIEQSDYIFYVKWKIRRPVHAKTSLSACP